VIGVRRRRISGLVWCSLAFLVALVPASYVFGYVSSALLWWLSYVGIFDPAAWSGSMKQDDWPRGLPTVVVSVATLVTWQVIAIGPLLVALWVYHRIVYRGAFERVQGEESGTQ